MDYELHLGDCLDVLRGMEAGSVDAVITDPPYSSGGAFRGDRMASTISKYVQTESIDTWRIPFTGDNRDQRGFMVWCAMWMGEARRVTKAGGVFVCFTDWRQLPTVTDAMQAGGWVWRGLATWWKPGIRMQRGRFLLSAEYVVIGSNGELAEGELSPQNVFPCAPVNGDDKNHIAEKPIDVLRWALSVTPRGSIVLDPFTGSGTTGVACKQMGRRFIGIELDPQYYAIAERRIANAQPPLLLPDAPSAPAPEQAALLGD